MKVHFIGIGGTGMGSLACMLHDDGHEVRGSDTAVYPPMSLQLSRAGIPVATPFAADNLAWEPDCVVVGNICSRTHVEVVEAQRRGLPLESLPSMLERMLIPGRRPLVVAGTHGKTTTSSLVAWMLRCAGQEPSWFIGGVAYDLGSGGHIGSGSPLVIEGDEYDSAFFDKGSKFLHYAPASAVLTSVEFDHADIFADLEAVRAAFRGFVELLPEHGCLVACATDPEVMNLAAHAKCRVTTFAAFDAQGDVHAADYVAIAPMRVGARRTSFRVYERGELLGEFSTLLVGMHNVANITAALALARHEGCELAALERAVTSFRGVRRRQELVGTAQGVRVLQDFAHHPTAVRATVGAVRRRYPEETLHVCFEPRSASSRRAVFFDGYREAFDLAGAVYIGPLYAPEKIPEADRLDTRALAQGLSERGVDATAFDSVDELATAVLQNAGPGDSVLVLSSGGFEGLAQTLLRRLGDPVMPMVPEDVREVDQLLASYGLPCLVAADRLDSLVIRGPSGNIVGCVHLEVIGHSAYFFGLAVVADRRGEGFGWVLADSILRHARTLGVHRVYLFPRDSGDFFAGKLGFRLIDTGALEPSIRRCANFEPSLEGAACMVCQLPVEAPG